VTLTVLTWLWAVIPLVCWYPSIYQPVFQSCKFFRVDSSVFCFAICPVINLSNYFSMIEAISIRLEPRFCAHIFPHHHIVDMRDNYYLSWNSVEFTVYFLWCTSSTVSISTVSTISFERKMFYKIHLTINNGHQVTERTEQQRLTAANAGKEVHSTGFVQTKSTT